MSNNKLIAKPDPEHPAVFWVDGPQDITWEMVMLADGLPVPGVNCESVNGIRTEAGRWRLSVHYGNHDGKSPGPDSI